MITADSRGYFGEYGGRFIPEILYETFEELQRAFQEAQDPKSGFWEEYLSLLHTYSCRPTPITEANRISEHFGGARVFIKREDLNHTGAHKLNNVVGQGLLAKRMGKTRLIAETGAGQHGVATATIAAKFGFECTIYMGAEDVARQRPNVFWMEKMGAQVIPVQDGAQTLKDAINAAMRDWAERMDDTHYVLGTACGPHPFPSLVSWLHSVIGAESREYMLSHLGALPNRVYACVGGGSNAMGIFSAFLEDHQVDLVGVEAGGYGPQDKQQRHATRIAYADGALGIAQGYKTRFLQNADGQMRDTHSISAGLDYIGISPILAHLNDSGRVRFTAATDDEVKAAFALTLKLEGLAPALESTHAFAQAFKEIPKMSREESVLISLSGRADKDIFTVAKAFPDHKWHEFIIAKAGEYQAVEKGGEGQA